MTGHWRRSLRATLLLTIASSLPAHAEDVELALVVSAEWSRAVEIDVATLRRIYLGRSSEWAGVRVHPVHLPADSDARRLFERRVLQRSADALERYWIEQALRGGPLPPREHRDSAGVIRAVVSRPGTLGYVPLSQLPAARAEGARSLAITQGERAWVPGEEGYPLRKRRAER